MASERSKAMWRESLSAFHLGRHGCDDEAAALAIDKHLATPPPASADALGEVERVARALAKADGITICEDATYALSSYGHRAKAALSAMSPAGEVERAVLAERERAAQICRDRAEAALIKPMPDDWTEPMWNVRQLAIHSTLHCASTAIREPKP